MKKGFTLLELIIVVIIIAILASLALPQYIKVAEKGRAAEGIHILDILRGSQMRYRAASPTNAFSAVRADLDADFTTPKYFDNATITVKNNASNLAQVTRFAAGPLGAYTLCITETGDIFCTGGAAGACTGIGITPGSCP